MSEAAPCCRNVARWMTVAALGAAAACGGSRGDDGGLPVTMTLTATAVTSTSIDLTWTPARTPPTRYEVYVDGAYLGPAFTPHVVLTTLAPSTRYCFVVYAIYFPLGATDRSNEACVSTLADLPPTTPSGLVPTVASPARIDLAWTAADDDWGIAGYRVHRDGVLLATVDAVAYGDTSVDPATRYCYTVTAVDTGGNTSPASTPACATTPADTQPPSAPTGLGATADDTTVTLMWNASTDDGAVADYRIYRDGDLVQALPAPEATPVKATDPGLGAYTQYCYEVVAVDRGGNVSAPTEQACTTTSWQRSVIFAAPTAFDTVGERNALAVDAAGKLHIGYSMQSWQPATRDYGPAELRYAYEVTGTWSDLQIAPSFSPLYRVAIAVDASARAHLAFVDAVDHFPWYAQPAGAWQAERVATESAVGVSLALDGGAQPHVAFGRSDGLRNAVRTAGVWSLEDVPGATASAEPALALDAWDNLHVVFADPASGTLCHATQASGPWTTLTIEPANAGGWHFVAAAVDGAGAVHASYHDGATRSLKYATNETGDWVAVTADGADGAGGRTAIATDAGGAAHISYVDLTRSRLKYATNASGSWESFDLDGAAFGPSGWGDTSIAIDADGRIHIVYFAEGSLKWATRP